MRNRDKLGRLIVVDKQEPAPEKEAAQQRGKQRERRRPRRLSPLQATFFIATLGLLGLGLGILWASGWLPAQFRPKELIIRGCYLTQAESIARQLKVTGNESYFTLASRLRETQVGEPRWFNKAKMKPRWGRSALLSVAELQPLVSVEAGGVGYWLCADGTLLAENELDQHPLFEKIRRLPVIRYEHAPGQDGLPLTQEILTAVMCLHEVMPGEIAELHLLTTGELRLIDRQGLEIRLGQPVELRRKIAALPKALSICAKDRSRLAYLDASDPDVFYQKWKEPVS